jgi:Subtilase family
MKNSKQVVFFVIFLVILTIYIGNRSQTVLAVSVQKFQVPNPINPWIPPANFTKMTKAAFQTDSVLAIFDEGQFRDLPSTITGFPGGKVSDWIADLFSPAKSPLFIVGNNGKNVIYKVIFNPASNPMLVLDTPQSSTGIHHICGKTIIKFDIVPKPDYKSIVDTEAQLIVSIAVNIVKSRLIKAGLGADLNTENPAFSWPQPTGAQVPSDWAYNKVFSTASGTSFSPSSTIGSVRVAVLDTGIDRVWESPIPTSINDGYLIPATTTSGTTIFGHGTGIAGLISGISGIGITRMNKPSGVAAEVVNKKVCDLDSDTKTFVCPVEKVVEAICSVATDKPGNPRVDVINLSFGAVLASDIVREAIEEAIQAGVVVIAAAGNSNDDGFKVIRQKNAPVYPAALDQAVICAGCKDGLISVGATGTANEYANFATYNSLVSLSAPGVGIETYSSLLDKSPVPHLHTVGGTSYATAYVSGAAALAISSYIDKNKTLPRPTPFMIKKWLTEGAKTQPVTSCPGTGECGIGVLNIPNTLNLIP